ncbi:MAG: zinc ABC transporter substrate-binding protein [Erysipelotrichaceae bacterium]
MKKLVKILIVVFLVSVSLTGCQTKKVKICVTNYAIEYLVKEIGGNFVDVCNISDNSEILKSQIKADYKKILEGTDLLLTVGKSEPYLSVYQDEINALDINVVDVVTQVPFYNFKRYKEVVNLGNISTIEDNFYDYTNFPKIDMFAVNPYVWLDPIAMTSIGSFIYNFLSSKYPLEESFFNERFHKVEKDLAILDSELQLVRTYTNKVSFVSITPTFSVWEKPYGVTTYPIILSKYGAVPNASQIDLMVKTIKDAGVKYIIKENGFDDEYNRLYQKIKEMANLKEINLYNLGYITKGNMENGDNYLTMMYSNLDALVSMTK